MCAFDELCTTVPFWYPYEARPQYSPRINSSMLVDAGATSRGFESRAQKDVYLSIILDLKREPVAKVNTPNVSMSNNLLRGSFHQNLTIMYNIRSINNL